MTGKPMLMRDLDRLRPNLVLTPFDRIRVIIGTSERKLQFDLECIACEELLEWDSSKGWWICPGCGQETTDTEGADLLRACYEGLREVVGEAGPEGSQSKDKDEGRGVGRWVRAMMGISKG